MYSVASQVVVRAGDAVVGRFHITCLFGHGVFITIGALTLDVVFTSYYSTLDRCICSTTFLYMHSMKKKKDNGPVLGQVVEAV